MTNDEINKLANEAMQSITVDDDEDYASGRGAIEYVIRQAVTTALEEAAKVALDHDCKRDYCSAACVFGIGKSIRALIPSTGTKE